MEQFILELVTKYPLVASIVMAVGVFRAIFKPIMGLIDAYVSATPSTSDDAAVATFKDGKVFRALVWFVDYTTSIKIPVKKSEPVAEQISG